VVVGSGGIDFWWGSPLETALAALTLGRHHGRGREYRGALDRITRWWEEHDARSTSDDATALAIAARAGYADGRLDDGLLRDALEAVAGVAARRAAPVLHLALIAWALADVVPDRGRLPWPELMRALEDTKERGISETTRKFALEVARRPFDRAQVIRQVVAEIDPSDLRLVDACRGLWVVAATLDLAAGDLDEASRGFVDRLLVVRTELVDRLALEVSQDRFFGFDLETWSAKKSADDEWLTVFDALLVDYALAPRRSGIPWLTSAEANVRFGRDLRGQRRTTVAVGEAWAVTAAAVAAGLTQLGTGRVRASLAGAILVFALISIPGARPGRGDRAAGAARSAWMALLVSLALSAFILLIDSVGGAPHLGDALGVYLAIGVGSFAVALLSTVLMRRLPSTKEDARGF
jgi:hypothetical protein